MNLLSQRRSTLTLTISMALATLSLAACGGGGSNVKNTTPESTLVVPPTPANPGPVDPTPPPSTPEPTTPEEPEPVYDPNAPVAAPTAAYRAHLDPTGVPAAWATGATGRNQVVGVIDNEVNASNPTLEGQLAGAASVTDANNPSAQAMAGAFEGHGTTVTQIMVGKRVGAFQQGIAYNAKAYVVQAGNSNGLIDMGAATAALGAFSAADVRVVNNSWNLMATEDYTNYADSQWMKDFVDAARNHIDNHNGLLVWANGNEGNSNPGLLSRLPYHFSYGDLDKGWLTVGAVNEDLSLASYSNACGQARNWCLVAPGTVMVMDPNAKQGDANYGYQAVSGTSFAAPQVSAAAALLMEQFPWMTSNQIRETLLTTATDLGAPGVDNVYGHGLLNAGKAMGGPGQLLSSQVFNVTPGTYTFFNDLTASYSSFTKAGEGTLVLEGNVTLGSNLSILDGTLVNQGTITSFVGVASPGVLAGNGTVVGDINNSGTIKLDNGGMTIQGRLYNVAGTMDFELGSILTVDRIRLDGITSISSKPENYVLPGTQRLIDAQEITLAHNELVFNSDLFLTGELVYTGTTVDVELEQVPAAEVASLNTSSFNRANAQQLDVAFRAANRYAADVVVNGTQSAFVAQMAQLQATASADQAIGAMDRLSGQGRVLAHQTLLESQQRMDTLANQRLQSIAELGTGAWATAGQSQGSLTPQGWARSTYNGTDAAAGFDWAMGDAIVGVAGYAGRSDLSMTRSLGSMDVDTWAVGAYGQALLGNWVVSGQLRYGAGDAEGIRSAVLGDSSLRYTQDLEQASAQLEMGRPLKMAGGVFTPFFSARYHRLHAGSTQDEGQNVLGLMTQAESYEESAGRAGFRFQRSLAKTENGTWWKWDGLVAYDRVFNPASIGLTAAYLGAPDDAFRLTGARMDRNAWAWGLGIQGGRQTTSWFFRWDGMASGHSETQGLSAGLKVAF